MKVVDQFAKRAQQLDESDQLASIRQEFAFPHRNGEPCVYFCGNSLGLMPIAAYDAVIRELEQWSLLAVEGHHTASIPWYRYHEDLAPLLAELIGALPAEVVAMNSLTVNLHLMLASFYQPHQERRIILLAPAEFPSDRYAAESHVRWHGLSRDECIVEIPVSDPTIPLLSTETIIEAIERLGSKLALVHLSAVHYLTGQLLDVETITQAAHRVGAMAGFDLAHAIGNVPLELHNWKVDYAVWCSYKYLNSGPGGVGGAFVHECHARNISLLRLAGWWGNDPTTRFAMPQWFEPIPSADSWQLSNAPVLLMAVHRVALEQFHRAGIERLRMKSIRLTGLLEEMLTVLAHEYPQLVLRIVSPPEPAQRGAQLSIQCGDCGTPLYHHLLEQGIIVDWRSPNIIRIAPAPLYCSFSDVVRLGQAIEQFAITRMQYDGTKP